MNKQAHKIIISGGGTGGHIYPAISIAQALRKKNPSIQILFVGAKGKMEMEKVPAAGFAIMGLPITGFQRSLSRKNLGFPFRLIKSLWLARKIIKQFQPDAAVGVGGYASGALLYMAAKSGIPSLIQEQNSYPGITNKLLKNKAEKICVAYPKMEKFFPREKIILTGNPVRQDLLNTQHLFGNAKLQWGIKKEQKVILVLGGSLGARTINDAILSKLDLLLNQNIFLIWQCGKLYIDELAPKVEKMAITNLVLLDFISRMDYAYAAADLIISRAGAGTISELCIVGKATILVPSPNVAEDHQTQNALALSNINAARLIRDSEAKENLLPEAIKLLYDEKTRQVLGNEIHKLALPDAADHIADEVLKLITENRK